MRKPLSRELAFPLWVCTMLLLPGCGEENADQTQPPVMKGSPGPGPMMGGPPQGPANSNPKIKAIMVKVGQGPTSLQSSLVDALKQDQPAWDTIQGKAKEYAALASELGKNEPTKGDKGNWSKLTLAFAESAAGLDKGAQAKDQAHTKEALDSLGNSCMACHREHRIMRGPGGGRPGGGGPGRGGPPPGGPGGPPPGGPPATKTGGAPGL